MMDADLPSRADFDRILEQLVTAPESPFTHLRLAIDRPTPWSRMLFGTEGEGPCQIRDTFGLPSNGHHGVAEVWTSGPLTLADRSALPALQHLVRAYFKPDRRTNEKTMLIQAQAPGVESNILRALQRLAQENGSACLLMADVDHLHNLNAAHGQQRVDIVLADLASVLESQLRSDAVVLQMTGGDEYLVLVGGGATEGIRTAEEISRVLAAHDFGIPDPVTMSIGIAEVAADSDIVAIDQLKDEAEAALKPVTDANGNVVDRRDKVRRGRAAMLLESDSDQVGTLDEAQQCQLALATVKALAREEYPFQDPWLNLVTSGVVKHYGDGGTDASALVHSLLEWLAPVWRESGCLVAANLARSAGPGPVFSRLDVSFAVAHGLLRSALLGLIAIEEHDEVKLNASETFSASLGSWSLSLGEFAGDPEVLLGTPVLPADGEDPSVTHAQRAILVRIGHSAVPLASYLFADVLTVDDRPAVGGGLPDFWQGSVARVVDSLLRYPNVCFVGVIGDQVLGQRSVQMLQEAADWPADSERLAAKTGLSETALKRASDRLSGNVLICDSVASLLGRLADAYREIPRLKATTTGALPQEEERFISFRVDTSEYQLGTHSGSRVATARMAYPLALQTLRECSSSDHVKDQAGVEIVDLIDYRLQLTDPFRDPVPSYFRDDRDELDAYYRATFEGDEGLFGRYLAPQLGPLLGHLTAAISSPDPFSTRRAILVIPRDLTRDAGEHDIRPFGLVSIRVIPRPEAGRIALYFSYTWRTVEALVGLPYSLYGSIRYSEYLQRELHARLDATDRARVIVRDLSYIAHSLHLTTEPYGQSIARRIIHFAGI